MLRNTIVNLAAQRKLRQQPTKNLYAKAYCEFYKRTYERGASLHQAADALHDYVDQLIRNEEHHYDLVVEEKNGQRVTVRDRRGERRDLLDLVSNSYNDLEHYPENREALLRFVAEAPLTSCLSRKIAGTHQVHDDLRRELADLLGYDDCILATTGYIAQMSTIYALFRQGDVIFSDRMNHSSIIDGCRLSHAQVIPFDHLDYDHLEELLRRHRGRFNVAGIVSDGVFSTKGAVANVDRIVELAKRYNCVSVIDDTHGVTVVGRHGRGVADLFDARPDVITGGFGKALGSFGGFAVASRSLTTVIDLLGRQNVNTTNLSPMVAAQALIHLRYYRENQQAVSGELLRKVRLFNEALAANGLDVYAQPERYAHPIFCLFKESERETLDCQQQLMDAGFLPSFFPPPVAPHPSLRFSLHRSLPEEEILRLADLLGQMDLFAESGGGLASPQQHTPTRRSRNALVSLGARVVGWAS